MGVGRVGRPHGLAGAFVVERASDEAERFAEGATVYVEREPATVVESKTAGGRVVVRLDRTVQDEMEERVHRSPVQIFEIDAAYPCPMPERIQPRRESCRRPNRGN